MARGRPPRMARNEAAKNAAHQGRVLEAAGIARLHIDFILFLWQAVIFIRVKRSHSRIRNPQDLRILFSDEIAGLRTIPLTAVVSREIWILLPWGAWQYFCIGDDGIREITPGNRRDPKPEEHPVAVQDPGEGLSYDHGEISPVHENAPGVPDNEDPVSPVMSDGEHALPGQDSTISP